MKLDPEKTSYLEWLKGSQSICPLLPDSFELSKWISIDFLCSYSYQMEDILDLDSLKHKAHQPLKCFKPQTEEKNEDDNISKGAVNVVTTTRSQKIYISKRISKKRWIKSVIKSLEECVFWASLWRSVLIRSINLAGAHKFHCHAKGAPWTDRPSSCLVDNFILCLSFWRTVHQAEFHSV